MQAPWEPWNATVPQYSHGNIGAFYFLLGLLALIVVLKVWDAYHHPEEPSVAVRSSTPVGIVDPFLKKPVNFCDHSSVVERQLPKLDVAGSNPAGRSIHIAENGGTHVPGKD